MGIPAFIVTITPDLGSFNKNSRNFEAQVDQALDAGLRAASDVIMSKLHQALARDDAGGLFNVGATGRAANNWEVIYARNTRGNKELRVEELEFYPGSYFIRAGTQGAGERAASMPEKYNEETGEMEPDTGGKPPIEAIRQWMRDKQISAVYPEESSIVDRMPSTRKVRYTKREGRPWKRSQPVFEAASWAIRESIYRKGMSQYSVQHRGGAKGFDYLKWVANQQSQWNRILEHSAGKLAEIYLQFLTGTYDEAVRPLRYRTYADYWGARMRK